MAQKVVINENLCIGCGMCVSVSPDIFAMGNDGVAVVLSGQEESCEGAMEAIAMCPAKAISCQ